MKGFPVVFPVSQLLERQRQAIQAGLTKTFESSDDAFDVYRGPVGDPGFFGPSSVTWKVHGDFPSMMVGGLSALMLQTLHPHAMAGVAEHSNYREDSLGRLQRTGAFVGTTTFGSTVEARKAIEIVKKVHGRVTGIAPDGRPYSANDPKLLTWVHVAEAACFLRAYRRFGPKPLTRSEIDSYFREMSVIAYELGALDVPESWSEVRFYFAKIRPELVAGEQALDVLDFVVNTKSEIPAEEAVRSVFIQAAFGIVPSWARSMLGIRAHGEIEGVAIDSAMRSIAALLRWAMGSSEVVAIATERAEGIASAAA